MTTYRQKKAVLKLFGTYFICAAMACAFISATTISKAKQKIEEAHQAVLTAEMEALLMPVPITLEHEDITGIKTIVGKRRQSIEKRQARKKQLTTTTLAAVLPAANMMPSTGNESAEFGDDGKSKFVPQDKDIPVIPVKYTAELDSASRSKIRENIIDVAKKHLGTRYVWAGKKPGGFDCSGFTSYMMSLYGIVLSPSSRHQALQGKSKPLSQAQVGDLIFFSRYGKGGRISHVALVVNNSENGIEVIHATSRGIVIDNINESKYWRPKILFAKDVISM